MLFVTMLIASRAQKTYPGFGDWTLSKIPNAIGWLLISLFGIGPLWVSTILGNGLAAMSPVLIFSGIRKFRGKPARNKLNVFLLTLYISSYIFFTLIQPNVNARLFSLFIYATILIGRCGFELVFDVPKEFRLSFWFTASMFFTYLIVFFARIITFRSLPLLTGPFGIDQIQNIVFLAVNVLSIGWTFGFIMMTNERLIFDLKESEKKQRELATHDTLTGIFNRAEFIERSKALVALVKRNSRPLGVILIDLDHFKNVNEVYGHAAGDAALCAFTAACREQLRETDIFARWGGEEFTILLPETDEANCEIIANRFREAVGKLAVLTETGIVHFTISVGISVFKPYQENIFQALSLADLALYRAKHNGRNCVVLIDQE